VITASLEEAGAAAIAPVVGSNKLQNRSFNTVDSAYETPMA
jgi:hypothetical protein